MRHRLSSLSFVLTALFVVCAPSAFAQRQTTAANQKATEEWTRLVDERADAILDAYLEGGDVKEAETAWQALYDQVAFHAPDDAVDSMLRVAELGRMILLRQSASDDASREMMQTVMRENDDFRRTIVFFLEHAPDNTKGALELLTRFANERDDVIVRYPELTAALITVHDQRLNRRFNENSASAPDPIALFDYFVRNEKNMFFGLHVPPEWLVHIVDATTTIDEMEWALSRYAGDRMVGARFFDVDYDYDHLEKGTPKKSTAAGWNLPNILRYGGVCADQAYFAMSVGKAIGVPTTYCVGRADSSHAWVGFVQQQGRNVGWNFTVGRYESYQRVRGDIRDPRTGQRMADAEVALRVEAAKTPAIDRWRSAALNDMAMAFWPYGDDATPRTAPPVNDAFKEIARAQPRASDASTQLWFVEQSLRRYPANEFAWLTLRGMANLGRMTLEDKKRWTDIVDSLCGRAYPDFSFSILAALVSSVDDADEQHRIWNALFRNFQKRDDIAAEIRMRQGKLWEEAGNLLKAGQCYEDVIKRYPNTGYLIVNALMAAEQVLRKGNRPDLIVPMYGQAWTTMQAPENRSLYFTRGTPWWVVGTRLAQLLGEAGYGQQAQEVQRRVNGG